MGHRFMMDHTTQGTGIRFTYRELNHATNKFADWCKVGVGGFGAVYRGILSNPRREIAVKKFSTGSKQDENEYVSELKVISQLRHTNLVRLLGWSVDQDELLLVYEFMPNLSLYHHLYGYETAALPWTARYNITRGVASALLYLHEEWEQSVLHSDVKPSNILLDSTFNAELGDFGLAGLVDRRLATMDIVKRTLGYIAPECVITKRSSKESDVYSFGVVALEIVCGRRPVESQEEPNKMIMVEWVWKLYREGLLVEAVDKRLEGEFDIKQMECVMVVGLWCCHPNHSQRPSIRQVIDVLNPVSPLPVLPSKLPLFIYVAPSLNKDISSDTSSSSSLFTGSPATTRP